MFIACASSTALRVLLLGGLTTCASATRVGISELSAAVQNTAVLAATDEGELKPALGRSSSMGGGRPNFGRSNSAGDWSKPSEGGLPFKGGFDKADLSSWLPVQGRAPVPERRL